ncbi:variable surface protein [Plasmodium gonderi]|uniref:Variable surface protein n=1 Tax=Plasmodium gonderi TaxID=77519 RepID=A0A1Y1JRD4_PLAGO|nr:variable surface protein [Plasmodium gonderi]GAW84028.1 variable surface protein [Plasmodium gonderi]
MEEYMYTENYTPADNMFELEDKNKEKKLSHAKRNNFSCVLSTVLAFLTSSSILLKNCPLSNYVEKDSAVNHPVHLVGIDKGALDIEEEWKQYTWHNWMIRLENDFNEFNSSLNKEKMNWLNDREGEFQYWIKEMESKWSHNEKNMDISENIAGAQEQSSTQNYYEWKNLDKTKKIQNIEIEWENWINKHDSNLNEWILKEWIFWKNSKIMLWLLNEWKSEEDDYWAIWENKKLAKWLHPTEKTKWLKWKERKNRESTEWMNWLHIKERVNGIISTFTFQEQEKKKKNSICKCSNIIITRMCKNILCMFVTFL